MNINELNKDKETQIAYHFSMIQGILGVEQTQSTSETPNRVARMLLNETCSSLKEGALDTLIAKMTTFDNPNIHTNDLIIVKDIPFFSLCEHHFMPFFGKVAVAYLPYEKIIGLSKIPRVVDFFSRRPNLQEGFTNNIANFLEKILDCPLVMVYVYDVHHTCVSMRGIEKECTTDTFSVNSKYGNQYTRNYKNELLNSIRR